jgi:fibronectin type 3 domain-containing protein
MDKAKIHARQRKRIISIVVMMVMVIVMLPILPQTESHAANYSGTSTTQLTLTTGTYTLANYTNTAGIVISGDVILDIVGTNFITGKQDEEGSWAGITVPDGSSVTIQGSGTLYATGGDATDGKNAVNSIGGKGGAGAGAGIGTRGVWDPTTDTYSGTIIIKDSVTVYATGGAGGAGGAGATVTVSWSSGGGGGGGGGFPGAGIGGGGANGGAGGNGGEGSDISPDGLYGLNGAGGGGGGGFNGGGGGGNYDGGTSNGGLGGNSLSGADGEWGDGGDGGGSGQGSHSGTETGEGGTGGCAMMDNGRRYPAEDGEHGGMGGCCGPLRIYSTAKVVAKNGSGIDKFTMTSQIVPGIGGGPGYYGGWNADDTIITPASPTLTATPGDSKIDLSWTMPNSSGTMQYNVYRGSTAIATNLTTNSYTDTNLTNGTSYSYTVCAKNEAGTGPKSTSVSAIPYGPPDVPGKPTAIVGDGTITVSWNKPNSNGAEITKYEIQRNGEIISDNWTSTTYVDTSVTNGERYYYCIKAYNKAGSSVGFSDFTDFLVPYGKPGTPSAPKIAPGNGQNVVSWSAPANNGSTVTKYELKRGSTVLKSDITGTSYTDTGLANGTSYSYTVRAYNAAGWGSFSSAGSGTPRTVPATPTISVTAGNKQNVISWTAPANNGASITKYEISRKTGSGTYTVLNSNYTSTSYTDPSLTAGTSYTYRIRAYNAAGWGGYSAEKGATPYTMPGTPGAPKVSPSNGQVTISWTAPAANGASITNYEVFQNGASIGTTTSLSMNKTGLLNRREKIKIYI